MESRSYSTNKYYIKDCYKNGTNKQWNCLDQEFAVYDFLHVKKISPEQQKKTSKTGIGK